MQTNNPVVEIGVILIALGFIAAGTTLLALHTIDLNVAIILWTLAASVAGINVALKAPSPTQQQLLAQARSEEHTSELQSPDHLVCRLLLEKKKQTQHPQPSYLHD